MIILLHYVIEYQVGDNMEYANQANFTEYFSDYLKKFPIPEILNKMPVDDNGISFAQRFKDRNYYKEIGSETEELFTMHLNIKCQEVVNKFLWKITIFNEKKNKLYDRYVNLTEDYTDTFSGNDTVTDKEYYNPQTDNSDNIINKNDSKTDYGKIETIHRNKDTVVTMFKSNPEIMNAIIEFNNVYENALEYLDVLFMGVL